MHTLNQTQFAKHIHVTKGYVSQLKQAGRLVFAENGLVDVEASIRRIKETEDPNRDDVKKRHAEERGVDSLVDNIGEQDSDKPTKAKKPKAVDANAASFSAGRAKEQHYKALQAEIEYNERMGLLVPKADMQAAIADVVTSFRQRLENMPFSLAAELVGQPLEAIRSRIKQEVFDVLSELSREFADKLAKRESEIK